MLRRIFLAVLLLLLVSGVYIYSQLGAINGPNAMLAPEQWRQALLANIQVPAGYRFEIYAEGLGHARIMQLAANGDVVLSTLDDGKILKLKVDQNGDGKSDGVETLLQGLNKPHGLLLEGDKLFVAEEHQLVSYNYGDAGLTQPVVLLQGLPTGGHKTRSLARGPDGALYLSIGSSCNACEESKAWRAAILRFRAGKAPDIFARGLRNTVGFDWQPGTQALYGVENSRDHLGDDVPDDELNLIKQGQHYGWPYVHGDGVRDPDIGAKQPAALQVTPPQFGLGAHVAPLSIHFQRYQTNSAWNGTALVAEHGSWNRTVKSGYQVIRLSFTGDSISSSPFLTGCVLGQDVLCRPVDTLELPDGAVLVSDDYAGAVYKISKIATN